MLCKKHFIICMFAIIASFIYTLTASGAVNIPVPKMHVEDRARVIDKQTENRLNTFLAELESKTGVQMVVLTVKSTGGIHVDQFSTGLANKWKLGQFEKNNGILMVIAKNDRQYSIEVGSGLEKIIPNKFCAQIGSAIFVPNFRAGNYNQGIYQGAVAVINRVAKEAGVTISGAPRVVYQPRRRGAGLSFLPLLLFILLPMFMMGRRRAHGRGHWGGLPFFMMMPFMFGGGLGGYRDSGSYTSGGFGGFGGGLGGGFGGGGASGSW